MALSSYEKNVKIFTDAVYDIFTQVSKRPDYQNDSAVKQALIKLGTDFRTAVDVVTDNRAKNEWGKQEQQMIMDFALHNLYPAGVVDLLKTADEVELPLLAVREAVRRVLLEVVEGEE